MVDKTLPVRNLIKSWASRDIDLMLAQFADEAIFENVPMDLIVGKEAIRAANEAFMALYKEAPWVIHNIAVTANGTVLTERTDVFVLSDGRTVQCRVMGAFEVNDDQLITHWRDYFDLADWNRQMGMTPDAFRKGFSVGAE